MPAESFLKLMICLQQGWDVPLRARAASIESPTQVLHPIYSSDPGGNGMGIFADDIERKILEEKKGK